MSSKYQKSTITAPKIIKKYFCVLTHQNNFISEVHIFLAKKCLKRINLLPHQNYLFFIQNPESGEQITKIYCVSFIIFHIMIKITFLMK
jgi:hypothetical protein